MAVNAKNLPALFTASTWRSDGRVTHNGTPRCIASSKDPSGPGNAWTLHPDEDLFRVSEADFAAIAGASVSNNGAGPYLVINGVTKEVRGVPPDEETGLRWLVIDSV